MTAIDWTMEPGTYEDMVSCLLANMNPEALRIEGAGGDGGRDVQFPGPGGLHIYELKSFTGRMTPGRRAQVKRSLASAATHQPAAWSLVVPIDPTPDELKWFDSLKGDYPLPLTWLGRAWLEAQLAERPYIWRFFREDANAQVIAILKELGVERAALERGVPDVIDRAEALVRRANELDPHYIFKIETDGQRSKVSIIPRYVGATEDRPITTQVHFRFDTNTPEGKAKFDEFKLANDFGLPMEIDAEFIAGAEVDAPGGLGGTVKPTHISLGPGRNPNVGPIDLEFLAIDESGETIENLTVTMAPANVGKKGVILEGQDRSGLFHARLVMGTDHFSDNTSLRLETGPFVPHELLAAVRFFAALHAPNKMALRSSGVTLSDRPTDCPEEPPIDPSVAEFVANLAMVQAATGIVREVDGEFLPRDLANAEAGASLARGEEAQMAWTSLNMRWSESPKGESRRSLTKQPLHFRAEYNGPAIVPICGFDYPIGRSRSIELVGHLDPKTAELLRNEDAEVTEALLYPEPNTHMKVRILSR